MKTHPTNSNKKNFCRVVIEISKGEKKSSYIPIKDIQKLETFLEKHSYNEKRDESIEWRTLAKDRIKKYKKAGLVLRGARYRENISQRALARKAGISQENISKIENGKRVLGEKVAKKLAKALHIDYKLLLL